MARSLELGNKKIEILYDEEEVIKRVEHISKDLNEYIGDDEAIALCNLKGAFMFFSDVVKHLTSPLLEIDFIQTDSYHANQQEDKVNIVYDIHSDVKGKKVLIIEDILDTGKTLKKVKEYLYEKGAKSVKICVLADKPSNRTVDIQSDFTCFTVPNVYVVGYGFDDTEKLRQFPFIGFEK